MIRKELSGPDSRQNSSINYIFDNALGKPLIIDSDDTTVKGLTPEKELGFNPTTGKLFTRINETTYLIGTLTAV